MDLFKKLSPKTKRLIYILTGTIFVLLILFIKSIIISITVSFVCFIILSLIFNNEDDGSNIKNKKEDESINDEKEDEVILDRVDTIVENLVKLEEEMALKGFYSDNELKQVTLTLMDDMYESVIKMRDNFGDTSITYEINKLTEEHFPNRIRTYLNLSEEQKLLKRDDLLDNINKIKEVVKKTMEVLNNDNLDKNERESILINIKY